ETPNIAARLQEKAAPDTLLISQATAELIAGQFSIENLGSSLLKGISRPMTVFRVLGKTAASRFQARAAAGGLTPFVGREREVALIREAWAEAVSGHGQTLVLRGEAGMGKSRLLAAARPR